MRREGADLTPQQRIQVAEYLTRRTYEAESLPASRFLRRSSLDRP